MIKCDLLNTPTSIKIPFRKFRSFNTPSKETSAVHGATCVGTNKQFFVSVSCEVCVRGAVGVSCVDGILGCTPDHVFRGWWPKKTFKSAKP